MDLTQRFISGLKKYNLTIEELSKWKWCGSNKTHLNYYKLVLGKDAVLPELTDRCVCGHMIKENCYIENGEEILVLGNCCIKKFVPMRTRTCEDCNKPHKNRTINKCNECIKLIPKRPRNHVVCKKCSAFTKNKKVMKCDTCRYGKCDVCDVTCNPDYKTCWGCKDK